MREVKQYTQVRLANENTIKIPTWNCEPIHGCLQSDEVMNYGHLVLELGMVYILQVTKTPDCQ